MSVTPSRLGRFLRSPRLIVGEVAGIALGGLAMALGLDHVARSPWFLAVSLLATASLSVVVSDQLRRAWRLSTRPAAAGAPAAAPYRREAVLAEGSVPDAPRLDARVKGRLGVWGSPLFHIGILLVVLAGWLRLLLGAEVAIELLAGETLTAGSAPSEGQRLGLLAKPFAFPRSVRLDDLRVTRYPSGDTRSVEGALTVGAGSEVSRRSIAVNAPIRDGAHALYLTTRGGAALLVEVQRGGALERRAVLLQEAAGGSRGEASFGGARRLRVTANEAGIGRMPATVEVRAMSGGALSGVARLGPGEAMDLPGGARVTVAAIVPWVLVTGHRDVSTPVVYLGFGLACLGGILMMFVIPVEIVVRREKVAEGTRVTALMRPQRFAPLFAAAFEDLWERASRGRAA